jgi:hypothetical protein
MKKKLKESETKLGALDDVLAAMKDNPDYELK